MTRRYLPLALAILAGVCFLAGAAALAHLVLLVTVPAGAVALLEAVSDRVVGAAGGGDVAIAAAGLLSVVAAAALGAPLLGLGAVFLCGYRGSDPAAPRARSIRGTASLAMPLRGRGGFAATSVNPELTPHLEQ